MKQKALRQLQKKRQILLYKYVAAVTLPILIGSLYLVIQQPNEPPMTPSSIEIMPGSTQARLHLSTGETIILHQDSLYLHEVNETRITNAPSHGIIYSSSSLDLPEVLNTLEVPIKGEFKLTLADGTKVWLNSCSKLIYPINFSGKTREVTLEGQAYFEVAENPKKPFIVKTKDYSIRVLGTAFNVMAYPDDPYSETTLTRGKIELQYGEIRTVLIPRKQARLEAGKIEIREVDPHFYTSWMNDRFYFDHENLASIMKKLARWYDLKIKFSEEEAKKFHFVGSIPKYNHIQDVCAAIELTTNVNFELKSDTLIIKTKEQSPLQKRSKRKNE